MRRARPLLGTLVEIAAEGDGADLPAAIEAAFAAIAAVQRLMSFHDPDSDVSRINAAAAGDAVTIDAQTFQVLRCARQISERSDGVFDVTVAPVLVDGGFLPPCRGGTKLDAAGYRDLDLLPGRRTRWCRKGWIDLGGIAKGYAVDCAVAALAARGVASGVVNAGGDLRCFGEPQPVHVRHPDEPTALIALGWLADAALAGSAGYFSSVERRGRTIDPLVDPRERCCKRWDGSVSVVAPDAMTADALTKVVRLAPDRAPEILAHFGAQAIVVDRDGSRGCGPPLLRQGLAA